MSVQDILKAVGSIEKPVFFAGSHKNSGKTTAMMALVEALRGEGRLCSLFTTGRDGESTDAIFGNEKPRVRVEAGELFVTSSRGLSGMRPAVIRWTAETAAGGMDRLGIFRAHESGCVEMHGPRDAAGVWRIIHSLEHLAPQRPLLVDGSLDRWAALGRCEAGVVLVIGAHSFGTPAKAASFLSQRLNAMGLPVESNIQFDLGASFSGEEEIRGLTVLFRGAATEELLGAIFEREPQMVVVPSPMHLFVSEGFFSRHQDKLGLLGSPHILGIAVNLFHVRDKAPGEYAKALRAVAGEIPLADFLLCE
ncbi:hypothetical protein KKF84_18670 [Myxococcota bacterium]|nr:hypothetical protein [Myxococcota bacterium]MBU1537346.1 hypothetical protein [Myxococcota bacterium]